MRERLRESAHLHKMAKTVVILGGSYGGLHIAHYLLKQKIPDLKVILVSKV